MSRNYKFHNPEGLYLISFATVFWVDVFVRRIYFDCIVNNLNYCIDEKGLEIYAWCIMPSHIHLVLKSVIQKPEELIRDLKSYTSKQMIAMIEGNLQESRREWLLNSFRKRQRLIPIIQKTNSGSSITILSNYGSRQLSSKRLIIPMITP